MRSRKPCREGDVRNNVLGEVGDRAVRLAVAHRRTVGPARRIHQHRRPIAELEALEDAGGGIADHAPPPRLAETGFVEEGAQLRNALRARRERAIADDARIADLGAELRRQRKGNVEAIGRQQTGGAIRPFHQHHGAFGQVFESKFRQLGRAGEPVKIGVDQRKARQLVALQQREGRARHLDRGVAGEMSG